MANRKPGQYSLSAIYIINYAGTPIDIKAAMVEMDIQSDLFNTCLHGTLTVKDSGDFQQNVPLVGEEKLTISYQMDKESEKIEKTFYIYSLVDKIKRSEDSFEYKLNFCSIELLNNRSTSLSESFFRSSPDTIVKKCLSRISTKNINIEKSANTIDYIAPTVSPFEVINYMTSRTISEKYPNTGTYVFYEDMKGFNFKTIDSMLVAEPVVTYNFNHKTQTNTDINEEFYSISKWEVTQHYDVLDSLNKGAYGATTRILDPFTRDYGVKTFNMLDVNDYKKIEHIDKDVKNSLHTSKFNFTSASASFIKFRMVYGTEDKENIIGARYSQINRITNGYKMAAQIPGNDALKTGDIITLNYLNYSKDEKNAMDLFLQGNYLIVAMRHFFTPTEYQMALELVKDSYYNNHEDYDRTKLIGN